MLSIDGSFGEGGGQIIRSSVTLSALTGRPIHIHNVRAKRERPGLQPQHLAAVQAMAQVCGAVLEGAVKGSTEFTFSPGSMAAPGSYFFDIGTAGATTLVLQTVLLPLALTGEKSQIRIKGGTYNPHAPSVDYLTHIFLPTVAPMGLYGHLQLESAGYYPRGGGAITCEIEPATALQPIGLVQKGEIQTIEAHIVTSLLPATVGERAAAVVRGFAGLRKVDIDIHLHDVPALSAGAAVLIAVKSQGGRAGFISIGERGKPMERVTEEATTACGEWLDSDDAVDEHLADQLVLPSLFAKGPSRWTTHIVSEHLRTMLWLAPQVVDVDVSVDGSLVQVCPR